MKMDIYKKIVKAAGIMTGDMVLIQYWMEESFSDDVAFLQAEIAAAGATPVMVVQNLKISQMINENATENTYGDKFFKLYEDADVVIDLMERPVGVLTKPLEPEKMQLLGQYMGRLFQTCATRRKMLQLRVPTKTMAEKEGLSFEEYRERMEAALDIDYDALKDECEKLKAVTEKHSGVTIMTGDGKYALDMAFGDRQWSVDAGDGDIPCGEISVAPVENETNGEVFFEKIYLPDAENPRIRHDFYKVVLTVKNGVIESSDNDDFNKLLESYGKENSTMCELGIGMNPGVTSLCGCAVLDEKMIGTFHIGIGDNTMFGGENEADFHNDLVGVGELNWK
ncbi:aminopeptidase [Butyrivibrio sp. XPD2002]|uniref:aminopeptidase n=1 Tax=Butyrivibrio sp. XPD2002 TaxID=1280665 RepID=UPI000403A1E4|nr:aminopeptidase [Butyrivibrio sp. XPD2002]